MKGFKQVLTNKSAVACLIGAFFGNAFVFGAAVFEVTFLRQVFFVPAGLAALIGTLVGTTLVTVGAIIGGHTVNRVGRKRLTVVAIFLAGFLTLLAYFMPYIIIFLALRWSASILIGIVAAAASNLALEQVPQFRGTMMSLASAFSGVGTAIGIAVAGTALNFYTNSVTGFQALGLTVGAFAFGGALVTLFFAKDPLKPDRRLVYT
jgi:MFS family permease